MKRPYWWLIGAIALFVLTAVGLRTCRAPDTSLTDPPENAGSAPGLTLKDVTLEQQNEQGQLLWKVDAEEVTYSPDQEVANLVNPEGELYQDGQLLYRVKANTGIIRNDGETILLEDNIVATGIQNKMVIRGQNLEWTPSTSILVVTNGLTGTHPQVRAKANEARIYDLENRMELEGEVVATTVVEDPNVEPWLKLQGEALQWKWDEETLDTQKPLRVERFENEKVTQVLTGEKGIVALAENRVTLEDAVKAQLLTAPMEMATEKAIWEVEKEIIQAVETVKVIDPKQQLTVTAQRGQFDLAQQVAYFNQDVVAIAQRNDGRLTSNILQWNLEEDTLFAEGAVNYRQSDPQLNIRGPRARGRIEEQIVVIDGGQVVTEIVPNAN